jgi:hypothetical protein
MQMPASNLRSIEIDGSTYHIKVLDGLSGFRTSVELSKVLLPLVGESFDASRHDDVFHGAPKTFREMALLLLQQIDQINLEDMIFNRLLAHLLKDGVQVKLADIIVGQYEILIELVAFAIEQNFGSLFKGKGLISRFQEKFQSMTSPT